MLRKADSQHMGMEFNMPTMRVDLQDAGRKRPQVDQAVASLATR